VGELARTTDLPNVAAAPLGDAPCCAKSIDDEARAEVPVSDLCSGAGVAGVSMVHSQRRRDLRQPWTSLAALGPNQRLRCSLEHSGGQLFGHGATRIGPDGDQQRPAAAIGYPGFAEAEGIIEEELLLRMPIHEIISVGGF